MAGKILGGASDEGISAEAQIGDRENEVQAGGARGSGDIKARDNSQVQVNTTKTDTEIQKADKVTIQNIPFWVLLILVAGWVLPTPRAIYRGLKSKWQARIHQQQ